MYYSLFYFHFLQTLNKVFIHRYTIKYEVQNEFFNCYNLCIFCLIYT